MDRYTLLSQARAESCRAMSRAALSIIKEYVENADILHSCDLLLTEAVANAARHAYPTGAPGSVEVQLLITPGDYITCIVSDWGVGFADSGVDTERPALSQPEAEGGRGLYIIASLANSFKILERDGKNSIHATITIPEASWVR